VKKAIADCGCVLYQTSLQALLCPMHSAAPELLEACKFILSRLQINGEWDDGCFYYNGKSATELESPIAQLQAAIKKAEAGN
jgi:hypothetical protein